MQPKKTSLKVSDNISLRLPDLMFAPELFDIIDQQREHLRKWLAWVDQTQSVLDTEVFIKSSRLFNKGGQRLTTFIFKDEKLIGSIGLVKIDKVHHCAEVGYWLSKEFQGQGIMSQSCRTLVDYAFGHLGLNRIEIKVAAENLKSQAIPLNVGFIKEATLREALFLYDNYYDLILWSMLKTDWELQSQKD